MMPVGDRIAGQRAESLGSRDVRAVAAVRARPGRRVLTVQQLVNVYDTRLKFLVDGQDGGKGAPMSCAMVYWGKQVERFTKVFTPHGAVLDLRDLHSRSSGEACDIPIGKGRHRDTRPAALFLDDVHRAMEDLCYDDRVNGALAAEKLITSLLPMVDDEDAYARVVAVLNAHSGETYIKSEVEPTT